MIAHSKDGLDMRYAISSLKMSKYTASLTTISTPHHGSLTIDKLLKLPKFMIKFVACCCDIWLKICGDKNPIHMKCLKPLRQRQQKNITLRQSGHAKEKMLSDIRKQSATYRQYFGNRMLYKMMLEKYKEYGLIER